MKLEQSFEVSAPLERVWQALIDVEQVAPCLPGAAVTGRNDDGSYNGTFTVKIGPTSASYAGKLEMEKIDEESHSATMQAQGTDKRGQGGAKATIFSTLTPVNGGTRVEVVTDYHITGRLARFGRGGMIEDISERLLRQFAERLQAALAGGQAAAAAGVPEAPGEPTAPAEPAEAPAEPAAEVPSAEQANDAESAIGPSDAEAAAGPYAPGPDAAPDPSQAAAPDSPEAAAPPPPPAPEPAAAFAPPEPSEPVQGVSLVASVLWGRVRRNPAPAAFVIGLLLAVLAFRRRGR